MAVKLWVASGAGNASTAGNWFPSGSPGALDIARFALNANNCNWDIASVNAISIEATYTGEITFATNVSIASSFTLEAENCITAGSAKSLTFTGTAFYNTNQTYVKNNCTDPFVNAAGRANLEYIFTGNGSTPVLLDTGKYPHVRYNGSKFSPKYVSNTLSTNANKISMQSFTYATPSAVGSYIPSQNDRDLRWEIDGQYNASADNSFHIPATNTAEAFDGGYGTWDFQAGFRFPTSSSNLYGDFNTVGLRFTWRNVELSNRAGLTNPKTTLQGTLYLDNLTVNSGIWFGNRPSAGATLLTINRPKIRGTLGLKQVADGMYISGTPNLDVAYGGTGLNMVINGRIPYGDSVQKLATSSTFTFSGGLLSAGNGITLNPISSQPSVSNTLWLNSGASNALYLDGSAVGGGGGGGGMTSFTVAGSSGSNQTITDGNTLTIAQGTGITSVASATDTITIGCDLEGTELKSTGETGGTKFLREDGDGTCSWQTVSGGSTQNLFETIAVAGQTNVVADSATDTLTFAAGSNMTITTNASTDTITFASSGGGGGGGGYPLFKHDEQPSANNFSPFRKLQDGDTIEIGVSTGGTHDKDVSVFTPKTTNDSSPATDVITANRIGAVGTNTGREYIFYGQVGNYEFTNITKYKLDMTSNMGGVATYFVRSMSVVNAGGGGITPVSSEIIIIGLENVSNVRVLDAGVHDILPLDLSQEEPEVPDEGEDGDPCRLLLICDHQVHLIQNPITKEPQLIPNYGFTTKDITGGGKMGGGR